jgi:hypothetical protein
MSRIFTFPALLLFTVAVAQAQEQPPAPKPGPEHAELKKVEGTWDVSMKMAESPEPMKGVATYKMECDGMWLVSDFKMDQPGFKFQGKGLDGYDPAKKKYIGIWVDSWSTAPLMLEGTHNAATKTTTMTGEGPGMDGKPQKYKTVTKHTDDNHMNFQMFMVGADGKEAQAFSIDYTRRK